MSTKNLGFWHMKKNLLIYSQMRFQLYQSYSITVIGFKSGTSISITDITYEEIQISTYENQPVEKGR